MRPPGERVVQDRSDIFFLAVLIAVVFFQVMAAEPGHQSPTANRNQHQQHDQDAQHAPADVFVGSFAERAQQPEWVEIADGGRRIGPDPLLAGIGQRDPELQHLGHKLLGHHPEQNQVGQQQHQRDPFHQLP